MHTGVVQTLFYKAILILQPLGICTHASMICLKAQVWGPSTILQGSVR